jgi:hypothetical protein
VTGGLLGTAVLTVLARPRLWALGLAGFLARGGIVLLVLPILTLPSVVGVTTFVGPTAITAAGLSARFVALAAVAVPILATWLVAGTLVGAAVDVALVREALRPDGATGWPGADPDRGDRGLLRRLLAVRLITLVPLGLALAWGVARLVEVGYRELILPGDLARPFVLRVLAGAPEVVLALLVAWLVGEVVGAVAVRLAIVEGRSAGPALRGALRSIARRPLAPLGILGATLGGSIVVVAPPVAAATIAWQAVRTSFLGSAEPASALLAVGVFVAAWLGGLVLAGIAAAWRSVAWSVALVRDHRGAGAGTADGGTL